MGEDKGKKRSREVAKKDKEENGDKKESGESLSRGVHILTERERRKRMTNMFSTLHSLLPDAPPKVDKSYIIEEAVRHIKTLEDTLQRLEKQKLEKLRGSNSLFSVAGSSKQAILSTGETFITDGVFAIDHNNHLPSTESANRRISTSHLLPIPTTIQTWTSANVVLNVSCDNAQFVIYATKKPCLFANICSILDKHRLEAVFAHISSNANCCVYVIQARLADKASAELPELLTAEETCKLAAGEITMWIVS